MWRLKELLPIESEDNIIHLGEGGTPLLRLTGLDQNFKDLYMKDEAANPTGSFKARGLSMAVSKARELGIKKFVIPTAGNAGGALAAYCAAVGLECKVFMPEQTPETFKKECEYLGADLTLINGTINECGQKAKELKSRGWFDVSTLKEPYRIEGKKTMGFEIAEQMNWELPDVILYPTGGGTGLIGIWKAFEELEKLEWIGSFRPRMIAVQSEGCFPIVNAFDNNDEQAEYFENANTLASGLCVPKPFGDKLILEVLRESNGYAIKIPDDEILRSLIEFKKQHGLLICPEGAAVWAALKKLVNDKLIRQDEKIVMLNTGSGYKYLSSLPTEISKKLYEPVLQED